MNNSARDCWFLNLGRAILAAIVFGSGLAAHAQIVADGATTNINGISVDLGTKSLTVGTNGPNTTLIVTNGGTLFSAGGLLGRNFGSNTNQVSVIGPNSVWYNSGSLIVGSNGSLNALLLSSGGTLSNTSGTIGSRIGATNNQAIVNGPGSTWINSGTLVVGFFGSFNTLLITNGGMVSNTSGNVGRFASASNNQVVVNGPGSAWNNSSDLGVGDTSSSNTLLISNGGTVSDTIGIIGLQSGRNNQVIVSGSGSAWNNSGGLVVGNSGSFNTMLITDGGIVNNTICWIGTISDASNNQAIVSGPGSAWNNSDALNVGFSGSFSTLLLTNAGTVSALGGVFVGFGSSSRSNCVTVTGGRLYATNAAATAALDIRRGTNVLDAGFIEADGLLLTNILGQFEFNGGTLNTRATTVANGAPFTVGNGSSEAAYNLTGNGNHSFADGLVVSSNATVAGNGSISGAVTVAVGGILSPGASIGTIVLSNSPALQGHLLLEISKSGTALTNDRIQAGSSLSYGGSLTVSNLGPDMLALGNCFQLFNASSYSGGFSVLVLPPLPAGLGWTNQLLVDGSITVVNQTTPSIGGLTQLGTNFTFNITGGSPGGTWNLLTATNVASPVENWTTNRSGIFDWLGNLILTNGINPADSQRYYRISQP